jgi:CDP-diacylglycerol pyrophosphatase
VICLRDIISTIAAGVVGCLGCAVVASAADRDALWKIVHEQCQPHWEAEHDPRPCAYMDTEAGTAILKDLVGRSQFLAIATTKIAGIESIELTAEHAPDLFAAAWRARRFVSERLGKELPRDAVGLAINSATHRGQDQAHIHIDCLRKDVRTDIATLASKLESDWAAAAIAIDGKPYWGRRIIAPDLTGINPFSLAASWLRSRGDDMGHATIVVAGTGADDDLPGFMILIGLDTPNDHSGGHGQDLLDHSCEIAAP